MSNVFHRKVLFEKELTKTKITIIAYDSLRRNTRTKVTIKPFWDEETGLL